MRTPTIGAALKNRMETAGLTHVQVATMLKTTTATISRWASDSQVPGAEWYETLRKFLGVDDTTFALMLKETLMAKWRKR